MRNIKYLVLALALSHAAGGCALVRASRKHADTVGAIVAAQGMREAADAAGLPCDMRLGDGQTVVHGEVAQGTDVLMLCIVRAGNAAKNLLD